MSLWWVADFDSVEFVVAGRACVPDLSARVFHWSSWLRRCRLDGQIVGAGGGDPPM
jgi:hypothetical protein